MESLSRPIENMLDDAGMDPYNAAVLNAVVCVMRYVSCRQAVMSSTLTEFQE